MTNQKERWVLQLCHGYASPFDDVARQWGSLFKGSGYKVLTVFLTGKPDERVKTLVGGDVVFFGYHSRDLKGLKRRQIKEIKSLHRQYQFSFAIAHRYKPIYIASHLPNLKVIGVSHAFGVYEPFFRRRYIMKKSDSLLLVGVSNAIRDDARRALPNFPTERIQTVYNHIDCGKAAARLFTREEARNRLGLTEDDFVVGNVGRLHPDKDQATLVEAFATVLGDVPQARLVIIGEGRLRTELECQIKELGISDRVELKGRVEEAFRYFRAFDVFALSSDYEPFGMVLLEAMVAPIPVVSTDSGGAPEVLGGDGRFFSVGDVDALAEQLLQISLESKECREAMARTLLERLHTLFSDEAARKVFEQLLVSWNGQLG